MMTTHSRIRRQRGFTLIEAIMVIVITGIIAGVVAVFIKGAVDAYFDTAQRAELTDAADASLRRMAREIRLALPNSLRVTTASNVTYIEFIATNAGGRYRAAADGSTAGNILDFTDTTKTSFDVLGPMPANPTLKTNVADGNGDYIVVYNLGPGYNPANAYNLSGCGSAPGCNIAQVSSTSGNTVTLTSNPFAAQTPPLPSPNDRFHVVPYDTRAVTYACPTTTAGNVTRYWGYGINATQSSPPSGGSTALVVGNATCTVDYTPAVLNRNGVLFIQLNLQSTVRGSTETISVFQQIHVDNSP